VFDQSREILLAVDLSRSMLTPDVKPSRLDRTKLLIQSLLEKLGGERVGLVVFAGTSFLQAPLSADYEILREFLPALGPDFLPRAAPTTAPCSTPRCRPSAPPPPPTASSSS
jgi:Ca-activated chloride channel family protein